MIQALVTKASALAADFLGAFRRRVPAPQVPEVRTAAPRTYQPLQRVLLTDSVCRTLFEEYEEHRNSERGTEETGWVLLGYRRQSDVVVVATLPAGTRREASAGHVQFNSLGQVVGSRVVRQWDRRVTIGGVVHTHPGTLRHPSDGDFRGDSSWVANLRGQEGVFAIGNVDGAADSNGFLGGQPQPHVQTFGKCRFSWYSLRAGDTRYRPLPVEMTLGPDLARPLHAIWPTIEAHAEAIERLALQQARLGFEVAAGPQGPALHLTLPLAEPGGAIHLLLAGEEASYILVRKGELFQVAVQEARIDEGVYRLLADLAGQS